MRPTTINAYLYDQYKDDENLQAFIDALNAAQQYYLDWFNSVGLPYYPGLSGDLLDWVAAGRYGIERQNVVLDTISASGMLNTQPLDTEPLNSFVEPESITLAVSDDVLKRIITWNLYKGDGKRFTMKWLKRRIMRFLVGTNGLDPNPMDPSFTVGPEDTSAISVVVVNDVLTVTVNGVLLSQKTQLAQNILFLFKSAFLSGILDLPLQYTYIVDIIAVVSLFIVPQSESAVGIATTLTTGTATAAALGGDGQYSYSWSWLSGGTGITIDNGLEPETTFSATGMSRGSQLSGVAQCTVTDTSGESAMATIPVTLSNVPPVTLSLSAGSVSVTGAAAEEATAQITSTTGGGSGPYTYLWTWLSGGSGIAITTPTASFTTFEGVIQPGATLSGVAELSVMDSFGQSASATVSVSITRVSLLSVSATPISLSDITAVSPSTAGSTTVSVSGGQTPYSYSWSWQSGGGDISIGAPTSSSTSFTGSGMSPGNTYSGTAQCVVTDALGQVAVVTVTVSIQYTQLTLSASPTTLSAVSDSPSESTASTTISASAGVAPYAYSWSWQSGGGGIAINSPSASATSFTSSSLLPGQTDSGTALCTVSDSVGHQASIAVPISIQRVTQPTVSTSPSSVSALGASANETTGSTTATISGGVGPYSYSWSWQSGGSGISINSPSGATTSFSGAGLSPGQTESGTALVTITDSFGQTATATVSVSVQRVTSVSLSLSSTAEDVTGAAFTETTSPVTATASGGMGPYTYSWEWTSGGDGISINSPSSATTSFTGSGLSPNSSQSGAALVGATDQFGQAATADVSVSISRVSVVGASVSPSSLSESSSSTTITTGATSVSSSGGSGSYTYAWSWQVGGSGISIDDPSSSSTTFTVSGASPGTAYSGSAQCVITDGFGQTAQATVSVSVACLGALQRTYTSGSGVETAPPGYHNVVIESWGAGNGGQGGHEQVESGKPFPFGGDGGGSGAYVRSSYACSGGQTLNWAVGLGGPGGVNGVEGEPGGASTVASGSLSIVAINAGGGTGLQTGGVASGGNQQNTNGNNGGNGSESIIGHGGAALTGEFAGPAGAGGNGSLGATATAAAGGSGLISFYYT